MSISSVSSFSPMYLSPLQGVKEAVRPDPKDQEIKSTLPPNGAGLKAPEDPRRVEATEAQEEQQPTGNQELTPEEKKVVEQLRKRDAEVRQHEQAHLASAGPYGKGPPNYEYQTGPDGKRYAIGGHVYIDTRPIPDDPEATIQKARIVHRAALAPSEPSTQDRKIAAEAKNLEAKAQRQIQEERAEELQALQRKGEAEEQGPSHTINPTRIEASGISPARLAYLASNRLDTEPAPIRAFQAEQPGAYIFSRSHTGENALRQTHVQPQYVDAYA